MGKKLVGQALLFIGDRSHELALVIEEPLSISLKLCLYEHPWVYLIWRTPLFWRLIVDAEIAVKFFTFDTFLSHFNNIK